MNWTINRLGSLCENGSAFATATSRTSEAVAKNMRLAAAAPDLLAALEQLHYAIHEADSLRELRQGASVAKAYAVLAKLKAS